MERIVVITGLGITTHLGRGISANWDNLSQPPARRATERAGWSRAQELASDACSEAFTGSRLDLSTLDAERIGTTFSASKPLFDAPSPGLRPPSPNGRGEGEGKLIAPDAINLFLRQSLGFSGESRNVIAACATGAYSIAIAASWIQQGLCDVVLAGSVEPYPHELIEAGFRQMGVMSPENITRPFDLRRTGFAFGEGAGAILLESETHAAARNAPILAKLSGWALGADSHSAFAFNSNGKKISNVIEKALLQAGLDPKDILHVNAHGTGTRHNDWIETQALMATFGEHAAKLKISATKASTGHLLGASGSVEFVLTVLALQKQFIPPTVTLETPDPELPLDYTPRTGHGEQFDHALSLSFGFGGPIGALIASRV